MATKQGEFILLRAETAVSDILIRCPQTRKPVRTGLTTDMVILESLPRVPLPMPIGPRLTPKPAMLLRAFLRPGFDRYRLGAGA